MPDWYEECLFCPRRGSCEAPCARAEYESDGDGSDPFAREE